MVVDSDLIQEAQPPQKQPQHKTETDDIEDFDDSPPRPRKGQLEFPGSQRPSRYQTTAPTPRTQRKLPDKPAKRKGFYEIDPDLLAAASAEKKARKDVSLANRPSLQTATPVPTSRVPALQRASKSAPPTTRINECPAPPTSQFLFNKPLLPPSSKGRGFEIDPDLLAAASPLKNGGQSLHLFSQVDGVTPRSKFRSPWSFSAPGGNPTATPQYKTPLASASPPSPSQRRSLKPNVPPQPVPVSQRATLVSLVSSDEIIPESSPLSPSQYPGSQPYKLQKRPAPVSPSLKSVTDSIEDHNDPPTKTKQPFQKRQKTNAEEIDTDTDSEPDLPAPHLARHVKPKHINDASTSGDSLTDPDSMEIDGDTTQTPSSQMPMHRRMLKRFKQSKPAPKPNTPPRPGYVKLLELHKKIALPKPPPPRPGTPPTSRWFVDNGLADTVTNWKETIHGTKHTLFQYDREKQPPPEKSFRITVGEFLKDGNIIIIKGVGSNRTEHEGVLKAIISGRAVNVIDEIGCVVRYAKPWFPVWLFGEEEPYRCLIGPLEVVHPKGSDVQMAG